MKIVSSSKLRSLMGVMSANVFNNLSSFIITIVAARVLGAENFAKLAIATAITTNLSSLLDFGTSTALVRLYNNTTDIHEKKSLIINIIQWKICLLVLISLLSYPISKIIMHHFSALQGTETLVYIAIISSGLHSFWITLRSIEQSQRDFNKFEIYTFVYGLLRIISVLIFTAFEKINITSVFISLYLAPLTILHTYKLISIVYSKQHNLFIFQRIDGIKLLMKIFSYSFWVGLSGFCFSFLFQIPQIVLAYKAGLNETSVYSVGLTFIPIFLLSNDAIRTIILPDITAIQTWDKRNLFKNKLIKMAPAFFSIMFIVLVLTSCLQYLALGIKYQTSNPIFLILGFSMILVMYLGYFNTLIHSLGLPHISALNNLVSVTILSLVTLILPKTAICMTIALAVVLIIGESLLSLFIINKQRDDEQS